MSDWFRCPCGAHYRGEKIAMMCCGAMLPTPVSDRERPDP